MQMHVMSEIYVKFPTVEIKPIKKYQDYIMYPGKIFLVCISFMGM